MLRLGIDPEKPYRATFICQDGLCCCNMALISFRLFRKNLGNLRDFFGQMVYRPPWQKISGRPMADGDFFCTSTTINSVRFVVQINRLSTSCPKLLFQNEVNCEATDRKMILLFSCK